MVLARDVDAAWRGEPEGLQVLVEGGVAFGQHRFHRADVEGVFQHVCVVDVAVVTSVPVVDPVTADIEHARVVDDSAGFDRAGVDRPGQGHDLHHGARLVDVAEHVVLEGRCVGVVEVVGVVARVVSPRDDPAGCGIHDQDAAALRTVSLDPFHQRLFGRVLDVRVERKHEVLSIDGILVGMRAEHDLAVGEVAVAGDIARRAAEGLLVVRFQAIVAVAVPVDKAEEVGGQRAA